MNSSGFSDHCYPNKNLRQEITGYLKSGSWHLLASFFQSRENYELFILNFVYPKGHIKIKNIENSNNHSLVARMKPIIFNKISNDTLYFKNMEDKKTVSIYFNLDTLTNKIISYTIL